MMSLKNLSLYSKQYTFESPRQQAFSLPGSFMQYFNQNWSGAVYEKLIQTCKYFFARHQIVPMKTLNFRKNQNHEDFWNYDEVNCRLFKDEISVNLKKTKLWIYDSVRCWADNSPVLISPFLKSVHRCTSTYLHIWGQDLEIEDFAKISTYVKNILIYGYMKVSFPDETIASLFDILTLMPNLKKFHIQYYAETLLPLSKNNTTIPVLPNLKEFNLVNIPIDDFPAIAAFIKLHPNTKFKIIFWEEFGEFEVEVFKTILKKIFLDTPIIEEKRSEWCNLDLTLENQYISFGIRLLTII